ncbi:hypothetical protein EDD15DRAFT_2109821, partial [Pisolithus albus]
QLSWEAEVVEYVNFLWQKTRSRKKVANEPAAISWDVPFLGPWFLPPTYLHAHRRPGLSSVMPDEQYLKPINVLHPLYYPQLTCCPQCLTSDSVTWEGWTGTGAHEVHGIFQEEVALGLQLRCNTCKARNGSAELGHCFAMTSMAYWQNWEHWKIPRGIPIFFHRCALTRELFDLIIELQPSSTSGAIAEQIKQLHLLEYQRHTFEYLDDHPLAMFSPFANPQGYAGRSITDEMVSEVYLSFVSRTRQQESEFYLRTLTVICGSLDSTFKVSNKASLTDKDCQRSKHLKGGILSVLNEENQIVSWASASNAEIVEVLTGLKRRVELL